MGIPLEHGQTRGSLISQALPLPLKAKVDANPDIALVVFQLLTPNRTSWDISKLRLLFKEHVVDLIQKITIPSCPIEDNWSCVRTYVIHLLGIYVTTLCNWLIL